MPTIHEGDPCPDFSLPLAGGGTIGLDDFKGRPFVLYFYPKDDTAGCTVEAKDFSTFSPAFEEIGVKVLGVSPDPVASHDKFRAKHDLTIRLAADEDKALIGAFGLWVEKSMYGRTYMGVERATALVDAGGRIARLWSKVKVKGHAEEVLETARALGALA
ncbi:peroxiredoxin [Aureimonas mangrovi]|uniref:peroxiredoxin n=1 Tax=Aureimonas mangrovi TaxID=2758041 RepID=UPI00163DBEC6|nr:peroxiredoxin [Aureimonas mangrovi]